MTCTFESIAHARMLMHTCMCEDVNVSVCVVCKYMCLYMCLCGISNDECVSKRLFTVCVNLAGSYARPLLDERAHLAAVGALTLPIKGLEATTALRPGLSKSAARGKALSVALAA